MASNNQNTAADEVAAEFIGSLFAGEAPATPEPTPGLSEKSAGVGQIAIVPISELEPFPSHPFQIRYDDEMASLVEGIKDYGVLTPLTARKKDNGRYELVSGHRRKHACELAGIKELPVIVRDMTPEQAVVAMADSNIQRVKILPSEKAWAYTLKLGALKKQGKRTDLTSAPVEPKLRSNEQATKDAPDSVAQIKRYIRLTNLIPPLLKLVDESTIAFRPAVEISYLTKQSQRELLTVM